MKYYLYLLLLTNCLACSSDKLPTIKDFFPVVGQLPPELIELSGLINKDDQTLIGHNDSGSTPTLYEFNFVNQTLNRTVTIANIDAIDWEDVTEDGAFIYVGDFGNNAGTRQDLVIYKIAKSEFNTRDSVIAQTINFNYPQQSYFAPSESHNFDCEAMISIEDQLYIFSKNRKDLKTDVYRLPKIPGTYSAEYLMSFEVEGLITGADILTENKPILALLGVENTEVVQPFIWLFYDFEDQQFFSGQQKKIELTLTGKMEGICFRNASQLLFSKEGVDEQLFSLDLEDWIP